MESFVGLFKTEAIATDAFHAGPYKTLADVEYEQDYYAALDREPQPHRSGREP